MKGGGPPLTEVGMTDAHEKTMTPARRRLHKRITPTCSCSSRSRRFLVPRLRRRAPDGGASPTPSVSDEHHIVQPQLHKPLGAAPGKGNPTLRDLRYREHVRGEVRDDPNGTAGHAQLRNTWHGIQHLRRRGTRRRLVVCTPSYVLPLGVRTAHNRRTAAAVARLRDLHATYTFAGGRRPSVRLSRRPLWRDDGGRLQRCGGTLACGPPVRRRRPNPLRRPRPR